MVNVGGITFELHWCRTASCDAFVLWPEGVRTFHSYRRMLMQYGEHCIAQKEFLYSTMKHNCILQQLLFKQSGSWRLTAPPPPSYTHAHTPPVQSNLAALDCHMFGLLNKPCVDKFASDCDIKDTVHTWLWSQSKSFFSCGIRRLVNCYTICVEKGMIMLRNDTHFVFLTYCYM